MAYDELVFFIRQEMGKGTDPIAIRNYLLQKNFNQEEVDKAFDEVFGNSNPKSSGSLKWVVIVGLVLLVAALAFVVLKFVLNDVEDPVMPVEPQDSQQPIVDDNPEDKTVEDGLNESLNDTKEESFKENSENIFADSKYENICPFEDPDKKYDCYIEKFESGTVECYKIPDVEEREFCYVAQDLYVLNS
jgi:hypothetical protein